MYFPRNAGWRDLPGVIILVALFAPALAQEPKLEPEELVARHEENNEVERLAAHETGQFDPTPLCAACDEWHRP